MIDTLGYDIALWVADNPTIAGSTVAASLLVMTANIVTMLVPTQVKTGYGPLADQAVNLALRLLNTVALNVLKNKNKDDKAK